MIRVGAVLIRDVLIRADPYWYKGAILVPDWDHIVTLDPWLDRIGTAPPYCIDKGRRGLYCLLIRGHRTDNLRLKGRTLRTIY